MRQTTYIPAVDLHKMQKDRGSPSENKGEDTLRIAENSMTGISGLDQDHSSSMLQRRVQAQRLNSMSNNDFIDTDPILRPLKAGQLMQRTLFNTKMEQGPRSRDFHGGTITTLSAKHKLKRNDRQGAFNTIEPTNRLPGSEINESTEASIQMSASRGPKIPRGSHFLKHTDGNGPSSNYANVELFRIPDQETKLEKQRRQKSHRISQIEDYKNYHSQLMDDSSMVNFKGNMSTTARWLSSRGDSESASKTAFKPADGEDPEPQQIIDDAMYEARLNQKLKKQQQQQSKGRSGRINDLSATHNDWRVQTLMNFDISQQQMSLLDSSVAFAAGAATGRVHGSGGSGMVHEDSIYSARQRQEASPGRMAAETAREANKTTIAAMTGRTGYDGPSPGVSLGGPDAENKTSFTSFQQGNTTDVTAARDQSMGNPFQNSGATIGLAAELRNPDMFSEGARRRLPSLKHANTYNSSALKSSPPAYERDGEDTDRRRRTPILHMQFDELATTQLHATYANKFFRQQPLQRRNPLKYMRNPNYVQGFVKGSQHYQYQENWSGKIAGQDVSQATDISGRTAYVGYKAGIPGLRHTIGGATTAFETSMAASARSPQNQSPWLQQSMAEGNSTFSPAGQSFMENSMNQIDKQRSASVLGALLTGQQKKKLKQNFNIKVHNLSALKGKQPLSENELLAEAAQISGRGPSVSPPQDKSRVVNNVVRVFRGESEVDRRRATEILDYIVRKRREASTQKERVAEAMDEAQRRAFVDLLDAEKRGEQESARKKTGIRINGSSGQQTPEEQEDGQFCPDDKYGRVLKKDIDKLTGGMQVVKESKLDLSKFNRLPGLGAPKQKNLDDDDDDDGADTQLDEGPSKMDFVKEQLQTNERFREMLTKHFKNFKGNLDKSDAIGKTYKKGIMDSLNQGLVRQAKQQIDASIAVAKYGSSRADYSPQHSQFAATLSPVGGAQLNIRLQNGGETQGDFAATMSYFERDVRPKGPPHVRKEVLARDGFSHFNKKTIEDRDSESKNTRDRMKQYARFLFYDGVEFLKPEQKRIYHFEAARKRSKDRHSPAPSDQLSSNVKSAMNQYEGRISQVKERAGSPTEEPLTGINKPGDEIIMEETYD